MSYPHALINKKDDFIIKKLKDCPWGFDPNQ